MRYISAGRRHGFPNPLRLPHDSHRRAEVGKLGVKRLGVEAVGRGAVGFTGFVGKKGLAEAKRSGRG